MGWYFTDHASGADTQTRFPGRDQVGISLTSGVYDHAEMTLTKPGAFEGLCEGQIIYLYSDTGNGSECKWGWYRITSVVSNDVIEIELANELGDPLTQDVSDVESSDGPFKTIGKAMDVVAAGDTVWVKKGCGPGAAYNDQHGGSGAVAEIKTKGTASAPIVFEGYRNSIGDGDGHWFDDDWRALLEATLLSNAITTSQTGAHYYVFKHLRAAGSISDIVAGSNLEATTWINCRAHGSEEASWVVGGDSTLVACRGTGNGQCGFSVGENCLLLGCVAAGNTDGGIYVSGKGCRLEFCTIHDNEGDAIRFNDAASLLDAVVNCTIDGNGHQGIQSKGRKPLIANNILFNCSTALALQYNTAAAVLINNLFAGYTTRLSNGSHATETGTIDLGPGAGADDVGFVDAAGGDYRLKYGSLGRGAGFPEHIDAGAKQRRGMATHCPANVGVQI